MLLTGRNDPCPCNSGKKHKACCLQKTNPSFKENSPAYTQKQYASAFNDPEWTKFRMAEGNIEHILDDFVKKNFDGFLHKTAWDDFQAIDILPGERESYASIFKYWMYYSWVMEFEFIPGAEGITLVELCLKKHPELFTSYQKRLIKATVEAPFSFFIVQDILMDQRLFLKDILLQNEREVKECSGTHGLSKGSIVFCRLTKLDNQSFIIGTAPYALPNRFFDLTIDFRDWLLQTSETTPLTPEHLIEYDIEIREFYFLSLTDAFKPIQFSNTDREAIILHEIFYDLKCTPRDVFDALYSLTPESLARPWEESTFDDNGNFIETDLSWGRINSSNEMHDNTSLGNFTITTTQLKVFVNSDERAANAIREIKKRLGDKVFLKNQKTTPMSNSDELQKNKKTPAPKTNKMTYTPEIITELKEHLAKYWVKWLDTNLPALGNSSPREASKNASGREKLEALFLDFDNKNKAISGLEEEFNRVDIDFLKKELKLTR